MGVRLHVLNALHHIHPLSHPSEKRVLPIKPRARHSCDEELRAVRVWPRIGHRKAERTIMLQVLIDFVLEFLAPDRDPSSPIAVRITSLNHKALDHPMEDKVVIVSIIGMGDEIFNCFWALLGKQFHINLSHARVDDGLGGQLHFLVDVGHGGIIFGGLFIEYVSAELVLFIEIGWFPLSKEVESILLICRAEERRIQHFLLR